MSKGEQTRTAILEAALAQASAQGFESLTIGGLAEKTRLSKSGLFAHFGSREDLQIAAIEFAVARFSEKVFLPALKAPRGLPRLRALFDGWLEWTAHGGLPHGCPLHAAAVEYDDRPGAVRDAVSSHYERLEQELARAVSLAIAQGHLPRDVDVGQFVFELIAILLGYQHSARLMRHPDAAARARAAFDRLVFAAAAAA